MTCCFPDIVFLTSMSGSRLWSSVTFSIAPLLPGGTGINPTPEWPALDGLLRTYSDVNQAATNLWSDAYLAAYAAVNGATLVTFDRGFSRYPVKSLILEPA